MDNELKEVLGTIVSRLGSIENKVNTIEDKVDTIEQRQDILQEDVRSIKVTIEHDIPKSISLLSEGHKGLSDKLSRIDEMADNVEEIKGAIVAIDALVAKNSNSIVELKKA